MSIRLFWKETAETLRNMAYLAADALISRARQWKADNAPEEVRGTEEPEIAQRFNAGENRDIKISESRQGRKERSPLMHSFNSCLIHCVWSTKNRGSFLDLDLRERLWPYLGGIARENKMKALAVGGVADHVHLLVSLPATLSVAKAIQLLKGNSSKWIHERFPN